MPAAGDAGLDRLYEVRPEEFVAERERIARTFREAGDAELAATVHRLRRPSVVAWSVNQAARARSPQVASLFDAGDALRAAIGSGDGAEIRSAMRARRTLVEELTDASLDFAAKVSPSPAGHRDAIAATWEAASLERDEVRNTVEAGRLSAELDPSDPAELAGRARPDESARRRRRRSTQGGTPRGKAGAAPA